MALGGENQPRLGALAQDGHRLGDVASAVECHDHIDMCDPLAAQAFEHHIGTSADVKLEHGRPSRHMEPGSVVEGGHRRRTDP